MAKDAQTAIEQAWNGIQKQMAHMKAKDCGCNDCMAKTKDAGGDKTWIIEYGNKAGKKQVDTVEAPDEKTAAQKATSLPDFQKIMRVMRKTFDAAPGKHIHIHLHA